MPGAQCHAALLRQSRMKNLAASVHARLAQRRAKTGEDFNVLLVRFTLERLLYRLSRSQHREQFILKGAMLFALWEPTLHRVTRDLDLLGFGNPSADRLTEIFRELCHISKLDRTPTFAVDAIANL